MLICVNLCQIITLVTLVTFAQLFYCSNAQLSAFAPLHLSRVLYKSTLFMQNKPNLQKSQVNVKDCKKMTYENKYNWTLGENKPNSKPIQSQSNPIQTQNKANTNPKQTQSNPIFTRRWRVYQKSGKTCAFGAKEMKWRRRESNPHLRDATAACSRYTTSPKTLLF